MRNLIVYIITLILTTSCSSKKKYEPINEAASLPQSFGFNEMNLKVAASSINKNKQTMTILYGNDAAIDDLKGDSIKDKNKVKMLALVTWSQKDDPHWFGAKIPRDLLSVEIVKSVDRFSENKGIQYEKYEGRELKKSSDNNADRIAVILRMKPSVMP